METQPLVSVIMTAYNREKYIVEAIESVINSSYNNYELIIVDDCSNDQTVNIAKDYAKKNDKIKVYCNEQNLGDYPNRNNAISYAIGKYIMFVDSDDKILEDGIKNCMDIMLKFPKSSFGIYSPKLFDKPYLINKREAIYTHFFKTPILIIGPGGTIFKKSFFENISKYPIKYGPANDMYFNLKVSCYTDIVLIPFAFIYYRIHENQEKNNSFSYLYNNYLFLKDAINELPLELSVSEIKWILKKNKRRFVNNIIKYYIKTRNLKKTKEAIKKANFTLSDTLQGIFHY